MLVSFSVEPEFLLQTDLLTDVPLETASRLVERSQWREITADDLIIDGTARRPVGVFILADGNVEVFRNNDNNGGIVSLANLNGQLFR